MNTQHPFIASVAVAISLCGVLTACGSTGHATTAHHPATRIRDNRAAWTGLVPSSRPAVCTWTDTANAAEHRAQQRRSEGRTTVCDGMDTTAAAEYRAQQRRHATCLRCE
jgi:hypothetical protein